MINTRSSMQRYEIILDKLQREKHVEVLSLSQDLEVSAVTIRKDLKALENKGMLFRTHGGASLKKLYINDRPLTEKEKIHIEEKTEIAKAASNLIVENDSIIIASGTTVQALASAIVPLGRLTVITSSIKVVQELMRFDNVDILQLGGYIRNSSLSVIGNYATKILENISCSKLFLGVDGIDVEHGFTTTSLEEAHLNKSMMAAAQKTIVLADSSKFGQKSFAKICEVYDVDEIITDSDLSDFIVKQFEERGVDITVVDVK
ncbi:MULTISPECIES: DeoR/GlpR family DNA-binding transcription regulator [Maribacter]|uniref:DeoR/GlpR family DNA-binding transcription regulator n=1 Tax=Maribacter TaxID=252356 RepID=UPI002579ED6B|nr:MULTISPECIES: DeoR/GlpR family DNA-binding transcription regulator [unclassified Maribacter]